MKPLLDLSEEAEKIRNEKFDVDERHGSGFIAVEDFWKTHLHEAQKEIAELEAKLWVAKDSALRTYDGLADKADKYDEANEMLEKMAAALLLYKDICTWKDESGDEFIAAKALKEYEDWKKR